MTKKNNKEPNENNEHEDVADDYGRDDFMRDLGKVTRRLAKPADPRSVRSPRGS